MTAAHLERKLNRLKADAYSMNNWRQLRFKIEQHHGRWIAPNGIVFELKDGVVYQYLGDSKEGVSELIITALDAEVPYVAVLALDLQGTPPEKRKALLEELNEEAKRSQSATLNRITIVEGDWLSKISEARWGDKHLWRKKLQPTPLTLKSPKRYGRKYHHDLIYPGDTFDIVG